MPDQKRKLPLLVALVLALALVGVGVWWARGDANGAEPQERLPGSPLAGAGPRAVTTEPEPAAVEPQSPVTVTGTVRGADARPLAKVVVVVTRPSPRGEATHHAVTDADGRWAIAGVPPGRVWLAVSASGHRPLAVEAELSDALGPVALSLAAPAAADPLVAVRGQVRELGGEAIEGALVLASDRQRPGGAVGLAGPRFAAVTDADGRYTLALSPGPYTLEVTAPDYAGHERALALAPAAAERDEDFALSPGAVIAGWVRTGEGVAVADAVVEVLAAGQPGEVLARARTGGDGQFRVAGLAPGPVVVVARAPTHASEPLTLDVGVGEQVQELALALQPAGRVLGQVVQDEQPLPGALLLAWQREPARVVWAAAATDAEGRFSIDGLAPGRWQLAALARDRLPRTAAAEVEIAAAQVVDATVALRAGPAGRGRLTPSPSVPAPARIWVELVGEGSDDAALAAAFATGMVDAAGQFGVGPLPTDVAVRLVAETAAGERGELTLAPGAATEGLTIPLLAGAAVAGEVVGAGAVPHAGAFVLVDPPTADPGPVARLLLPRIPAYGAETDEEGRFLRAGLALGTHAVRVVDRAGQPLAPLPSSPGAALTLAEPGVQQVQLQVESRTGELGGVVLAGDDLPVAGAWVRAVGADGRTLALARTDENGLFVLGGLAQTSSVAVVAEDPRTNTRARAPAANLGGQIVLELAPPPARDGL